MMIIPLISITVNAEAAEVPVVTAPWLAIWQKETDSLPRVDSSHPNDVLAPNLRKRASGKFGSDPWTPPRLALSIYQCLGLMVA